MDKILRCEMIEKEYKRFALKQVSFEVEDGQVIGLIGANGAGKTTLINILSGMDSQFRGEVWIGEAQIRTNPKSAKNLIGLISENIEFFEDKSVVDNGYLLGELYTNWNWEAYFLWMDRLNIPKDRLLYQMSKGEKIKYQICFAMAHQPEILLLDEPTSGLDPVFRKIFRQLLKEISDTGIAILLSTHILDDLKEIANTVLVMDDGKIALVRELKQTEELQSDIEIKRYLEKRISVRDLIDADGK